ncbi:MAG: SH3 domain-containing protein [Cyanobacteria bacterium P01_H01_bin.15]
MRISSCLQFILGFLLALICIAAGAAGVGYYIFSRNSEAPPKPIFAEELPPEEETKPETVAADPTDKAQEPDLGNISESGTAANAEGTETADAVSDEDDAEKDETEASAMEEPELDESPDEAELPPGAYRARVTWPQGLSLRNSPGLNSSSVGGVAVNAELIIIETSGDQKWQKVRVAATGQEAWVKAGNVVKIDGN